jgi:peptide/nickel transport system permease protein/oligopeptide transport system permease protein
MLQFLLKRFIGLIFVVMAVSFITFILGYLSPNDPITVLLGQRYTPARHAELVHAYGLDLPWWQQYWNYLSGLLHGNLGYSFRYERRPVLELLKDGVPISMEIAFWGLVMSLVFGIPSGVISAVRANTWLDTVNMSFALILYALPSFLIATFAQVIIVTLNKGLGTQWPVSNWGEPWRYTLDDLQFKIVPIFVFGATAYAFFARLSRTTMLEVLRQDYVRTARAKGLKESVVIYKHALRNALIPLVTVIGLAIGTLVGGAFFIETIFNIRGIAGIAVASINQGDYAVIQGTTMLVAGGVVIGNLISDLLYAVVDPRIKIE